ncbi:uncharacterized protein LOC131245480 [Magnolia sinica]|uniref:uncharacterized protein LOC131245480 n=1 Tax=Magnolia sinica TaxID=86752 RepID=UPI00265A1B3B|nr:uncharacterized protein LOC131245480 [Magnolia sinica]
MVLALSTMTPTCGSTHLTCRGCNKVGHVVSQCKEWCAYCQRTGHGIQDCRTRAYASSLGRGRGGRSRSRSRGHALSATTTTISSEPSVSGSPPTVSAEGISSPLTPAMLQQIVQALSAAGMSGSGNGEGTWEG